MSYRSERHYRRRRGVGCLGWLVALVWIVLLGVLAYRFFLRPQVSEYIGQQIGERVGGPTAATSGPNGAIEEGAQQALPTVVSALPSGQLRISEAQANDFLAARAGSLGPIDGASVQFVPGELQATIQALGTSSTARMGLAAQNGRVIAINPDIDGLLGQFIDLNDLTGALEQQFNDELAAQNRRVTDVQINEGEVLLTVE